MYQTLVIYGDSISTGAHGAGGYHEGLQQALGAKQVYNYAIGGSGLSTTTPDSLVGRMQGGALLHPEADAIVVWLGSNDWYWGAPLGELDDTGEASFCGAMHSVLASLRGACPSARIVWPTPLWRYEQPHGCEKAGEAWVTPNASGITHRDIEGAVRSIAPQYNVLVPDMRAKTGIDAANAQQLLEDNVHPNAEGYTRILPVLVEAFGL